MYANYLSNDGKNMREFAYFVRGQAYGAPGRDYDFNKLGIEKLRKSQIDYFLVFTNNKQESYTPNGSGKVLKRYTYACKVNSRNDCSVFIIKPLLRS